MLEKCARRFDLAGIAIQNVDEVVATFEQCYGFTVVERRKVEGEFSGMTMVTMQALTRRHRGARTIAGGG